MRIQFWLKLCDLFCWLGKYEKAGRAYQWAATKLYNALEKEEKLKW